MVRNKMEELEKILELIKTLIPLAVQKKEITIGDRSVKKVDLIDDVLIIQIQELTQRFINKLDSFIPHAKPYESIEEAKNHRIQQLKQEGEK